MGYLGGQQIDLHLQTHGQPIGVWHHPGDHPAFEGHIRFGQLTDGRWYVQWTGGVRRDWAFRRRDDAELAITEILASRGDGKWTCQLEPG